MRSGLPVQTQGGEVSVVVTPIMRKLFYAFARPFWGVVFNPLLPIEVKGTERVPRQGGFLLLGNHVTWLDPIWMVYYCNRPVRFMASDHFFKLPVLGTLLQLVGAFPKAKFTKDKGAIQTLVSLYQQGEGVALFPEGERNWDGYTVPAISGIGKLIKGMGCPVVFAQLRGGHQLWPRWGHYMRYAPVTLEFFEPYTFPDTWSPEQITEEVNRRLHVEPDEHPAPKRAWGRKLAFGLPNFLFACPSCFTLEGLKISPDGNQVHCAHCGQGWQVEISTALTPLTPQTPPLTVRRASQRLLEHFSGLPVQDRARFEQEGLVLAGGNAEIRVPREQKALVLGQPRLYADRLELVDGQGGQVWGLPFSELLTSSVDGGTTHNLRCKHGVFRLVVEGESAVKWHHFLIAQFRAWQAQQKAATDPSST